MRSYFDIGRFINNSVNQVINAVNNIHITQGGVNQSGGGWNEPPVGGFSCPPPPKKPAKRRKSSSTSGVLFTVFGGILLFSLLCYLVSGIGAFVFSGRALSEALSLLVVMGGCGATLLAIGCKRISLAKRFALYCDTIGSASFCTIAELASACGQSKAKTVRDLRSMIKMGLFPYARIDAKCTTLMLDEDTYRQYIAALEAMEKREQNSRPQSTGNSELDAAIAEGRVYIKQMNDANDRIPGEQISHKIDLLANVTAKIFACVAQKPQKLPDIKKFLRYYLPTTQKLLAAYAEFEEQPIQSESICAAKIEIEKTLDTINEAFSNLLASLYDEQILDLSTDMSVLEAMFKKEGLTGSDFK